MSRSPHRELPWGLAVVPGLSLGLLAFLPFAVVAWRRRTPASIATAAVYVAATAGEWALVVGPRSGATDTAGTIVMAVLTVIGTAHAFLVRDRLAPTPEAPPVVERVDESTVETCARVSRSLDRLRARVDKEITLPPSCRQLFDDTVASIRQVLRFGAAGGHADAEIRGVDAMVTDYLPTSLETYAALPTNFAHSHRNANGRTAVGELEIQLTLLRDRARELADTLYEDESERVQEQSVFLEGKFGRSELDLP